LEEFTSTSVLRLFEIGLLTPGRPSVALGARQLHTEGLMQPDLEGRNGTFSPDGRWLAYQSNNTGQFGQFQVYVRPFPNVNAGRWQVSTGGGTRPVWARNGRELFFLDENSLLTSVTVQTAGASFSAGKPTKVLQTPYFSDDYVGRTYDVSADGRRFLMVKGDPTADQATPNMVVVLNWFEELKRLVPTK
jgi:serine/threonine-protein kinase